MFKVNTTVLYVVAISVFFIGVISFAVKKGWIYFPQSINVSKTGTVFTKKILVVDPVQINASLRSYLLNKYQKQGEVGIAEEIGLGDRTTKIIASIAKGTPVFVKQAIPNCGSNIKESYSPCIDITPLVLKKLNIPLQGKSFSTFEESELTMRLKILEKGG